MNWRAERAEKGFTLLEMMVALAMISVVMLALFRLQHQSIAMLQAETFYSVAPLLANNQLSRLIRTAAGPFDRQSGDFAPEHAEYTWEASITPAPEDLLGASAERLRRIEVMVSLARQGFNYRLVTWRLYD